MMNIKIKKISIGFAALVLMGAAVSCKRTSGKAVEPEYECIAYVWQEAVSYTHLDVYKRQQRNSGCAHSFPTDRVPWEHWLRN